MPEPVEQITISADTKVMLEGLAKVGREKACEIEWITGLMVGLIMKQLGTIDADLANNLRDEMTDVLYGSSTIEKVFSKSWVNIQVKGGPPDANS